MTEKRVTIDMFLTPDEIKKAIGLGNARAIAKEIIEPNIERINKALGQENEPLYLGYMVEYVVGEYKKIRGE